MGNNENSSRNSASAGARISLAITAIMARRWYNLASHIQGGNHKTGAAPRVAAMSLAALRPTLGVSRPQMALDAPRQNALNLHEAQPRLPPPEVVAAGLHNPQGLHWEDASAPVNPHLISLARNYHHDGLPVVKLWQADRNMVSIGLDTMTAWHLLHTQTMTVSWSPSGWRGTLTDQTEHTADRITPRDVQVQRKCNEQGSDQGPH